MVERTGIAQILPDLSAYPTMAALLGEYQSRVPDPEGTADDMFDWLFHQIQQELDGKAAGAHGHGISEVSGLPSALDGKAASAHTHAISDVSGLQDALNGKAAISHTHAAGDITGLPSAGSNTPVIAGAGAAGSATAYAREDHVHPTQNQLAGTVTIAESSLTTLTVGVRRVTVALAGAVTSGNYLAFPVSALSAGYGLVDAVCGSNGNITIGLIVPVLTIGSYSFQVRVVRLLT